MEFTVVDPRLTSSAELTEGMRQAQTLFKLNHTMPFTEEYNELVGQLPLKCWNISIVRQSDAESVASVKIDRISYDEENTN